MNASRTLVILLVLAIPTSARGWALVGRVVDVEPSYMPGRVVFALDEKAPKAECASSFLSWRPKGEGADLRTGESSAVLETLTSALAGGHLVLVTGSGCDAQSILQLSPKAFPPGRNVRGSGRPDDAGKAPKSGETCKKDWNSRRVRVQEIAFTASTHELRFAVAPTDFIECQEMLRWLGSPQSLGAPDEETRRRNARATMGVLGASIAEDLEVVLTGEGCNVCWMHLVTSPGGS